MRREPQRESCEAPGTCKAVPGPAPRQPSNNSPDSLASAKTPPPWAQRRMLESRYILKFRDKMCLLGDLAREWISSTRAQPTAQYQPALLETPAPVAPRHIHFECLFSRAMPRGSYFVQTWLQQPRAAGDG